jgi:hypothetical protein
LPQLTIILTALRLWDKIAGYVTDREREEIDAGNREREREDIDTGRQKKKKVRKDRERETKR